MQSRKMVEPVQAAGNRSRRADRNEQGAKDKLWW